MKSWIKFSLWLSIALMSFAAFLLLAGGLLGPSLSTDVVAVDAELKEQYQALRDVKFDRDSLPVLQVDVDYAEGEAAQWYPKGEAPVLRDLVDAGELPPVQERVGPMPLVMEGVDGVGRYGGSWTRLAASEGDVSVMEWRLSGANLVRWSPMGYPIRPHLAKGWEMSEDAREWTFYLREGVKWSDGHPFTSEDIFYWWEMEQIYFGNVIPNWLLSGGEPPELVQLGDYAFKFVFKEPYGGFLEALAGNVFFTFYAPKHYLSQFHPELGDSDLIEKVRDQWGYKNSKQVYDRAASFRNPQCPSMAPWVSRADKLNPPFSFERNPYYWVVDAEGNQLPYIDRIVFDIKHAKLVAVSASTGLASMQSRNLSFDNYTLLMEGREAGGYDVYHWFPATRSAWTLWPNLNRQAPEGDLQAKWKAEFLRKREFRQALSLAIDRETIIDAVYHGVGEPSQIEPGEFSPFHSETLKNASIEFDPEAANRLLDSIGLDQRDSQGMRTFPDGSTMLWYVDFTEFTGAGPAQFVVDDWKRVGVRAIQRERARSLFSREQTAMQQDFAVWSGESEFHPLVEPRSFVPDDAWALYAPGYGLWYNKGGMQGLNVSGLAFEPELGSPIRKNMELLTQAQQSNSMEERVEIFQEIAKTAAEELWSISIATAPPELMVVDQDMRNVPEVAIYGAIYNSPANAGIETFYYDENQTPDPAGVVAQVKDRMRPVDDWSYLFPEGHGPAASNVWLGKLVKYLLIGIGLVGLGMVIIRHPYIGRRFAIMVPTLLAISVIVFAVIQLPPGDFLETRMMELSLSGEQGSIEAMEELRELFLLDEPMWKRYTHWLGLNWFLTFESSDKGLLQGNLGISMQTLRSVNNTVADRVLLTFCVSLLTIVFTWAVALPIGIYTAVKQYSIGDYVLTFLGFIGMCVPNFLLAILMMYWGHIYLGLNLTGLFSPEYAATPDWSVGKFMDMLLHLVIPVFVIATGSTAGMIRVMRANLLDELKKPYVTTAMAKGVRPFKLLMKYPVRLALNPFISGIGGLFPALLSGASLVAIILSLPMVGPLLLEGLLTEDLYLSGSLLMVFSLLGVFGTLVSDLLLMIVDPRIRMEGGNR